MAKKLKRVVESTSYPLPNDLWLDTSGENPVLKINRNGDWIPVSGGNSDGGDTPSPDPTPAEFYIKFRIHDFGLDQRGNIADSYKTRGYDLDELFDMSDDTLPKLIEYAMKMQALQLEQYEDRDGIETDVNYNYCDINLDLFESGLWGEFSSEDFSCGNHPRVQIMSSYSDNVTGKAVFLPKLVISNSQASYGDIPGVSAIYLEMKEDGKYWIVS